ncbi:MAG: hypothetical protein H6Q70_2109 [Firmicutes bacterium]|nr:hypothetical protein [Bacillota bacterium]
MRKDIVYSLGFATNLYEMNSSIVSLEGETYL